MAQGTVKSFDSATGQGFIAVEGGGADVFVHWAVGKKGGLTRLEVGQRVEFEIAQGSKGPQAENVRVLG